MKNKKTDKETQILNEKEWYKEKILEMLSEVDEIWILMEIIRFIRNITK